LKTKKIWSEDQKNQVDKFNKAYDKVLKRTFLIDTPYILRELRNKHKFTQEQLSNVLNISKYTLAHYETGKSRIPSDFIIKMACLYEVSTDLLLGFEEYNDDTDCNFSNSKSKK